MLNEIITINYRNKKFKRPLQSIIVPNLLLFIPFAQNSSDEEMLKFNKNLAEHLIKLISERGISHRKEEMFEFDIPDMSEFRRSFPEEEQSILLTFESIVTGLTKHFLPYADVKSYGNKKIVLGKRYTGLGWFSSIHTEV